MPGKQDTNNPIKEATSLMFKFSPFFKVEKSMKHSVSRILSQ